MCRGSRCAEDVVEKHLTQRFPRQLVIEATADRELLAFQPLPADLTIRLHAKAALRVYQLDVNVVTAGKKRMIRQKADAVAGNVHQFRLEPFFLAISGNGQIESMLIATVVARITSDKGCFS